MNHLTLAAQGAICAGAALEVATAHTSSVAVFAFDPDTFTDDQSNYVFGGLPIAEVGTLEPKFGFSRLFSESSQIRLSLSPQSADGDSSNSGAGIPPGGSGTGGGDDGGPKGKRAAIIRNHDQRIQGAVKELKDWRTRPDAVRTLSQMSAGFMEEHPEIMAKLRRPKQISYIVEAFERITYEAGPGRLLTMIGEAAVPSIIPLLRDSGLDDSTYSALDVLVEIGRPALKTVTNAMLRHENKYIREGAAEVLGEIGDPSSAQHLFAVALRDEWRGVRVKALRALAKIPFEDGVASLEQYRSIARDRHRAVRAAAAGILSKRGFPEAIPLLHDLLHDGSVVVRSCAFSACRKSAEQIDLLAGDLKHGKKSVRGRSAAALAMLMVDGGNDHLFALIDALDNRDLFVRRAAAEKLHMFDRRPALYALIKALGNTDKQVRLNAIASLTRFDVDTSEALPTLERLAEEDKDDEVKRLAQWAIEEIGPPEIIDITRED